MSRYRCGGVDSWKGGTWSSQTYNGTLATDLADLDSKASTIWTECQAGLGATNKGANAYGTGADVNDNFVSVTGDGAPNSHWQVAWKQYLPNNALGGSAQGIRKSASGGAASLYEVAPPGGAENLVFSKANYDAGVTAMNLIVTRSIDYNSLAGANRQRTLTMMQLNEAHSAVYWDNNPAWITSATWNSATYISWLCDNESDTFYRIQVFVKSNEHGWGWWSTYAMSARGADITSPTHTNTDALVCLTRANDDFVFQTMHLGTI